MLVVMTVHYELLQRAFQFLFVDRICNVYVFRLHAPAYILMPSTTAIANNDTKLAAADIIPVAFPSQALYATTDAAAVTQQVCAVSTAAALHTIIRSRGCQAPLGPKGPGWSGKDIKHVCDKVMH